MSLAPHGLTFVAIAALITIGAFAYALQRRSWSLWVLAFAFTLVTLWLAWVVRDHGTIIGITVRPERPAP